MRKLPALALLGLASTRRWTCWRRQTDALKVFAAAVVCFEIAIASASPVRAATLLSGDVTIGNYYPNLSTLYDNLEGSGPTTGAIVLGGSGYEFTFAANTFSWFDPYSGSFNTYGAGGFNGFVLSFTGIGPISDVTNSAGSQEPATSITFDRDTIYLGYNGGSRSGDALSSFDVTFSASTPEPSTWAMLLLGFAGLGFAAYRRAKLRGGVAFAAV